MVEIQEMLIALINGRLEKIGPTAWFAKSQAQCIVKLTAIDDGFDIRVEKIKSRRTREGVLELKEESHDTHWK